MFVSDIMVRAFEKFTPYQLSVINIFPFTRGAASVLLASYEELCICTEIPSSKTFPRCCVIQVCGTAIGKPCQLWWVSPWSLHKRRPAFPTSFLCTLRPTCPNSRPSARQPAKSTHWRRPWRAWQVNGQNWSSTCCSTVRLAHQFCPQWMRSRCCWTII